jgi:hypothetical protein
LYTSLKTKSLNKEQITRIASVIQCQTLQPLFAEHCYQQYCDTIDRLYFVGLSSHSLIQPRLQMSKQIEKITESIQPKATRINVRGSERLQVFSVVKQTRNICQLPQIKFHLFQQALK